MHQKDSRTVGYKLSDYANHHGEALDFKETLTNHFEFLRHFPEEQKSSHHDSHLSPVNLKEVQG